MGYSTKFYTEALRPEVQPLTLLYTIFDNKGIRFIYLSWTNGTPFTYLVEKFASILTAVKAVYSTRSSNIYASVSPFGPFINRNGRFPNSLIYMHVL